MTETDAITGHENDTNNKAVSGSHNSTINGKTVDNSFNVGNGQLSDLIVLHRVEPKYPPRAKERKIEGWVQLEITVTASGEVSDAKVIKSSHEDVFDNAALSAVKQWQFQPAFRLGQAVMRVATLKIVFSMDSAIQ